MKAFNHLLICLEMGEYDVSQPMTWEICCDPYHPVTQLVLTLYSMEPPFYKDLNNASRQLDQTKLKTLGPFAMAIFRVLEGGDVSDRKRDDGLELGHRFKDTDPLGYFCRCFLLFRGALMNKDWIDHWRAEVGKDDYFRMHGCTSTSKNMEVALGFSQCNIDYDVDNKQAVLFVYSINNI